MNSHELRNRIDPSDFRPQYGERYDACVHFSRVAFKGLAESPSTLISGAGVGAEETPATC
jgi:hypothetical protein